MFEMKTVDGVNRGEVKLYALSTCVWCKRTRQLLDRVGVRYSYVYVDLLEGDERERALEELMKYNPGLSFPTIVIDGSRVIVGFEEEAIRGALGDKDAGQ